MLVKNAVAKGRDYSLGFIRLLLATVSVVIASGGESVQAQSLSLPSGNPGSVVNQIGGNGVNTSNLFLNPSLGATLENLVRGIISETQVGNLSIVNTAIQVTVGNSNPFLISPVGTVFRSDASLNVPTVFLTNSTGLNGFAAGGISPFNANHASPLVEISDALAAPDWQPGAVLNLSSPAKGLTGNSQMTVTVLSENLVRLNEPGRLLSLEIQPPTLNQGQLPTGTVAITRLPELLTGGIGKNATDLIVSRDGTIQLIGTGIAPLTEWEPTNSNADRSAASAFPEAIRSSDRKRGQREETTSSPFPAAPTLPLLVNAVCIDTGVVTTETKISQAYQSYLNSSSHQSTVNPCNVLNTIQKSTGIKTAILYGTFVPTSLNGDSRNNQLELVLVSSDAPPIRRRISAATREKVADLAQIFRNEVSDPSKTDSESYKESAQQLYQWLIAPIEADLKQRGIQNITFILDTQLNSLPLAALYDSVHQQFLIQKYSIGLMPNLSLTDTRYRDIRQTQVLAMGRSTFTGSNQAPLPAVPVELSLITKTLWSGKLFLNQQFTLENLKTQHQHQKFGIIHLATHGEFKPEVVSVRDYSNHLGSEKLIKPEAQLQTLNRSYIQLWDTKLRLNQLRQLRLDDPPVELLVLSACRTALGDSNTELGFAGLAVEVGVKSVLASLWYVSDAGTLGLVTEFYQQLKTAPLKAEALRRAQIAMLSQRVQIQHSELRWSGGKQSLPPDLPRQTDLSHPYYWAGFTLVGNPW